MARHPRSWNSQSGNRRHRRKPSQDDFTAQVIGGSVLVAVVVWQVTGAIQESRIPPEQRLAVERSVYYSGCSAARAAGAAPIHRGSPGYRAEMDGDDDGIACEAYY